MNYLVTVTRTTKVAITADNPSAATVDVLSGKGNIKTDDVRTSIGIDRTPSPVSVEKAPEQKAPDEPNDSTTH